MRRPLSLLILVLLAPFLQAKDVGGLRYKEVREIYVSRGDIRFVLPELICQLEVPAILDLGILPADLTEEGKPDWDNWWTFDPFAIGDPTIHPTRIVSPYEKKKGSIGEVLKEFCELNGTFHWEIQNETVYVIRGGKKDSILVRFPTLREFAIKDLPIKAVLWTLADRVKRRIKKSPAAFKEMAIEDIEIITYNYKPVMGWGGGFNHLWPREEMGYSVSFHRKNVTLLDILEGLIEEQRSFLVVALADDGEEEKEASHFYEIYVTNWSSGRRKISLRNLVVGLDDGHEKRYGYRDIRARVDDFERELRRRHHFYPEEVADEIENSKIIERIVKYESLSRVEHQLQWLISLEDKRVADLVVKNVLGCQDRKRRGDLIKRASCIPGPGEERFGNAYMPLWKKLADEDRDPRVRTLAKWVLEWYRDYQKHLKKNKARH